MKKIFTLIAMAFMAVGVNAQGSYCVSEGDEISAGQTITSVENITMTYSESGGTFINGKKTVNWVESDFAAYTNGSANGKFSAGSEPTGCYYKFDTVLDGTLVVGVQLSPNKGFFIVDKNFNAVTPASYMLPASNDATESQELTQNEKGEPIIPETGVKSNGTVTFNVEANGTYYVLATGTKMGFFGFKYTASELAGIADATTEAASDKNAPVYNLAGQRVGNDAKGVLIQNGKKFVK